MLKEIKIALRTLESTDLDFLFSLENDRSLWDVSGTTTPFSEKQLANYIRHAKEDIAIAGQFRFVIDLDEVAIGCIDLYDYDWQKQKAGVGIVVLAKFRRKGYAKQALKALIRHAWETLKITQLYTTIFSDNKASIALFKAVRFELMGKNNYVLSR